MDEEPIDWKTFLTDVPLRLERLVEGAIDVPWSDTHPKLVYTELRLPCDTCTRSDAYFSGRQRAQGQLFPEPEKSLNPFGAPVDLILAFSCKKCQAYLKAFALRFSHCSATLHDSTTARVEKFGEWPEFAPPTPARLTTLIGPDRDLFLKGRRSEIAGLGIGAFGYYRRVVENQKGRFLDEVIRVARLANTPAEIIGTLETAKKETQFSRAVGLVKDAIPQVLFIRGQNPFTLLHNALSNGLHNEDDEECLRRANAVRLILVALTDRLTQALKDEKELSEALGKLTRTK